MTAVIKVLKVQPPEPQATTIAAENAAVGVVI